MDVHVPPTVVPARVFLTGGSGLLGSHIAERLLEAGHQVVALQRPTSNTGLLKEMGCSVTLVRPSVVYSERDRFFTPRLVRLLRLPVVPVLGSGGNTVPVVYAGNVSVGVE